MTRIHLANDKPHATLLCMAMANPVISNASRLLAPHRGAHGAPVGVHGRPYLPKRGAIRRRDGKRRSLAAARVDGRTQARGASAGLVECLSACRGISRGIEQL